MEYENHQTCVQQPSTQRKVKIEDRGAEMERLCGLKKDMSMRKKSAGEKDVSIIRFIY